MLNGRFWPIFPSIEDKRGGPGAADAVVISEADNNIEAHD